MVVVVVEGVVCGCWHGCVVARENVGCESSRGVRDVPSEIGERERYSVSV